MNKCNNCTKFLTCDRRHCNQVTFLQAGQLDRLETNPKYLKIDINTFTLQKRIEEFRKALCEFGMIAKEALEEDKKKFIKALEEENKKWIEK